MRGARERLLRRYSQDYADGSIAQWLERLTADQQVPGSNPGWPFIQSARDGSVVSNASRVSLRAFRVT